jgi:hypothetical protein
MAHGALLSSRFRQKSERGQNSIHVSQRQKAHGPEPVSFYGGFRAEIFCKIPGMDLDNSGSGDFGGLGRVEPEQGTWIQFGQKRKLFFL